MNELEGRNYFSSADGAVVRKPLEVRRVNDKKKRLQRRVRLDNARTFLSDLENRKRILQGAALLIVYSERVNENPSTIQGPGYTTGLGKKIEGIVIIKSLPYVRYQVPIPLKTIREISFLETGE